MEPGICYGASDLALAGDVVAAANRIRPQLPPAVPVFSSPLRRCRQLAALLHPTPVDDERLREMHFGAWEMLPWQGIQREALDGWAADPLGYTPPGGESAGALQHRVRNFVAELALQDIAQAALVTHAGVMKVVLGMARDLPSRKWMALSFDYESVVAIEVRRSHLESNRLS
ncbi:MAG: histidine phosphatase family protein [Rhodocyclales bacterium]|nr:histidine phosphatase family protein [Rhodocyclales bacterium]